MAAEHRITMLTSCERMRMIRHVLGFHFNETNSVPALTQDANQCRVSRRSASQNRQCVRHLKTVRAVYGGGGSVRRMDRDIGLNKLHDPRAAGKRGHTGLNTFRISIDRLPFK
jgi:hypothetical protein